MDYLELKNLLGNRKINQVIELLKNNLSKDEHLNHLILNSARYYDIELAINQNTISMENANVEKQKITDSILKLIDELKSSEDEEQKFSPSETEISNERDTEPKTISSRNVELESTVLMFLNVFNKWYFSPLRINKWGSLQAGFHHLGNYSTHEIKEVLIYLESQGKIKRTKSKKGNPIYKIK
nr:hypothetical protein [uncultured Psychroserpens sp.]